MSGRAISRRLGEHPRGSRSRRRTASITDGPFGSNLKTSHYTTKGPRVIRLQNIGEGCFIDEEAHISTRALQATLRTKRKMGMWSMAMLGAKCPGLPGSTDARRRDRQGRLRSPAGFIASLSTPAYVMYALNSHQSARKPPISCMESAVRALGSSGYERCDSGGSAPRARRHRRSHRHLLHSPRRRRGVAGAGARNLKRYRASVLKAAVEGRLVPTEAELARAEGRDYEPASVLLERILAERRRRWEEAELAKMKAKGKTPKGDRWRAKYKEPIPPDD